MTKVFFKKNWTHNAAEQESTYYTSGMEFEVEDEVAELAVLRGYAEFSNFAEDDLFDIPGDVDEGDDA